MRLIRYNVWKCRRPVLFDEFTDELHYRIMIDADKLLRMLDRETPAFLLKLFHPFRSDKYTARGEVVFVECAILCHHLLDMGLHRILNEGDRQRVMKKMKELLYDDIDKFAESAGEQLLDYDKILSEYPPFWANIPRKRQLVPPAIHVFAVRVEELVNHSPQSVEFAIFMNSNRLELFSFYDYLGEVELN